MDLSGSIEGLAQAPQSVSVDGQQVSEQSLTDVMAADRYLAKKAAQAAGAAGGMRFARLIHQGNYGVPYTYPTTRW